MNRSSFLNILKNVPNLNPFKPDWIIMYGTCLQQYANPPKNSPICKRTKHNNNTGTCVHIQTHNVFRLCFEL